MKDIHQHKFIICGGDGLNPLGIIRSLGEEGIHPYLILKRDKKKKSVISASKYIEQIYYANAEEDVIDILIKVFGDEANKPFVFLTDEGNAELLDQHYDIIKNKFFFFDMGRKGRLTQLTDKSTQCQMAKECGFLVPKYEVIIKGDLPTTLHYPVITKTLSPNEGQWKKDMHICNNEEELKAAFDKIEAPRLIVEEYISGDYEFDLKGISIGGGKDICFTYSKVWNSKDEVFSSFMRFEPCDNILLMNNIKALMQAANYSGIFDIEFIHTPAGELYFLEVNWRTGMYNYNHTMNGFNIPYLWAQFTLSGNIDTTLITPQKDNYTSLDELAAFSVCLRKPKLLVEWLRLLKVSDCLYYYNREDRKPCHIAWSNFFKRKIQALKRFFF